MGAAPPLPSGPVSSVDEAVARMQAIAAALPETDGLACFNRMYLVVTEQVRSRITEGFFADPTFMNHLDVAFANLYFAAVDGWATTPPTVVRSWAVLLSRRDDTAVAPLQFAIAGLNAHINRDLAVAVTIASRELGTSPADGGHHDDYDRVNGILDSLGQSIRESFETGVILELDRRCAGLENLVGNFSITAGREVAWANACTLWHLGDERFLSEPFLDGLDRTVAFANRNLLIPLS